MQNGKISWANVVCGTNGENYIGDDYIQSVRFTSDGGIIAGGYFTSKEIILDDEHMLKNADQTISSSYFCEEDGLIIKYNEEGQVEWAKAIGGTVPDYIKSVALTSDGGIIAGGYFQSSSIKLGEGIKNNGSNDMLVIKYVPKEIPEIVTKQAKVVGGSNSDSIESVVESSDGGLIAGGYFKSSSINVGEGEDGKEVVVNKNDNNPSYSDGLIIKYNNEGKISWAKVAGGSSSDSIQSVASTSDGGLIAGGYFGSDSINLGKGENGEEVVVKNNGSDDGIIVKYRPDGVVEWAKVAGGSSSDSIQSVASTSDGGIIAGGYFGSDSINLGEGVNGEDVVVNKNDNNPSYSDGLIIKYNSERKSILGKSSRWR